MDVLGQILSSRWKITPRLKNRWWVETVDQCYDKTNIKKDGTPKKGAKPRNIRVTIMYSKDIAQHICDVHNTFLTLYKDVSDP